MIIVGLTGSIGSGKTTFARYMSEHAAKHAHFESWELIAEVANALRKASTHSPLSEDIDAINAWLKPLPQIVEDICHKPVSSQQIQLTIHKVTDAPENFNKLFEYLDTMTDNPKLLNTSIAETNKEQFRSLLQWLGGYLVKSVGSGIWYDEIVRRIKLMPELELATVGGVRFPADARRLTKAGGLIILIERPAITIQDANEITERERGLIESNITVENNGSLDQMRLCAHDIYEDLINNSISKKYVADKHKRV